MGDPEADLAREINAHLRLLEDKFTAQGMSRDDARAAAKRAFGGVEQTKEQQRDARSFRWLAGWSMDLKLGIRMLRKSPGLTAIALIALTVGIGGGAAFFEFSNDLVRGRLPFEGGERLVGIVTFDTRTAGVERRTTYEFFQWRGHLKLIEDVGAARLIEPNVTTLDGQTAPVSGAEVSASIFHAIPTPPLYGRTLSGEDERIGSTDVVVLGYDAWHRLLAANPAVIGTTVRLGNTVYEIVGVMPKGFGFPSTQSLWTPLRLDPADLERAAGPAITVFGKLAPGIAAAAAQGELDALAAAAPDAAVHAHLKPRIYPYIESTWADSGPDDGTFLYSLNLLFLGLIGICSANVATLVFARTMTRESEITVRSALGASRARIVSQMVAEALVLTGMAAVVGLAGAAALLRMVRDQWTVSMGPLPFWWDAQLEVETIVYVAFVVILASLLVGAVPALKATTGRMQGRLKTAGSTGGTRAFGRLWTGVTVGQVAFTVMFLTIVAGLTWSTSTTSSQYAGLQFPRDEYLSAMVEVADDGPKGQSYRVLRELQRRMASEPGVRAVTYASSLPAMGGDVFRPEFADGHVPPVATTRSGLLEVRSPRVASNYFDTFKQRIVAGRAFRDGEAGEGREVAIVDESFVRLVLAGRPAVGRLVRHRSRDAEGTPGPWHEIVGVVTDIAQDSSKPVAQTVIYRPLDSRSDWQHFLIVHTAGDAATAGGSLRRAAFAVDPDARLQDVKTLRQVMDEEVSTYRYLVSGYATVAAVALLLATAGIYALVSFTLSVRTREIGIRMALGAAPRRMLTNVLSRSLRQVGAGVVLGAILGVAFLAQGILDTQDFRLSMQTELTTVVTAGVAIFVILVAAVSCWVPLRRALRTDPTQALRAD